MYKNTQLPTLSYFRIYFFDLEFYFAICTFVTILFRIIYGKEENIKNVIAVDLNSTDKTKQILEKLSDEHENIKVSNWKECKEIFDNIDNI